MPTPDRALFSVFIDHLKEHDYYISNLSVLEVQEVERQASKDKSNEWEEVWKQEEVQQGQTPGSKIG